MKINNKNQFNIQFPAFRLLSTYGPGSIVPTIWGTYVMPLSISDWNFIRQADNARDLSSECVDEINDNRFIAFLNQELGLGNIQHLIRIPHADLDNFNKIDLKNNSLAERYRAKNRRNRPDPEMFYVPAKVFPRWMYSTVGTDRGKLLPYEKWLGAWTIRYGNNREQYFCPPRDADYIYKDKNGADRMAINFRNLVIYEHSILRQVPLVLICPNGHIVDIPWDEYFCAKLDDINEIGMRSLLSFNRSYNHCNGKPHDLRWIIDPKSGNSWGFISCNRCHQTVNLEGIMNLRVNCNGEKPWDSNGQNDNCNEQMRVAIVTSNSIYYPDNIKSLFITDNGNHAILNVAQQGIYRDMKSQWQANFTDMSKEDFCDNIYDSNAATDDSINQQDYSIARQYFIEEDTSKEADTKYREEEYNVLMADDIPQGTETLLKFSGKEVPHNLQNYIEKVVAIDTLCITDTEIGFSRAEISFDVNNHAKIYSDTQNVISYPATQNKGEGIFISFKEDKIQEWLNGDSREDIKNRYRELNNRDLLNSKLDTLIEKYGRAKFYLLHTFAHILIKELEFQCGYPSASIAERIYYSDKMSGLLIYTSEGSAGSMGGLVGQTDPEVFGEIIENALIRAINCSSDPICWENHDNLNYAVCFSCAMLPETSCEYMNNGLDRQVLVSSEFGFFKELVACE